MKDRLARRLRMSAFLAHDHWDRHELPRGVGPGDVAPAPAQEDENWDPWELWVDYGGGD